MRGTTREKELERKDRNRVTAMIEKVTDNERTES